MSHFTLCWWYLVVGSVVLLGGDERAGHNGLQQGGQVLVGHVGPRHTFCLHHAAHR
jgi:hypothetical protein